MPLDPPAAGSIQAGARAARTAARTPSTVEMSGRGAPSRTATPMPTLASGTGVATRSPSACALAGGSTTRSSGVPSRTAFCTPPAVSLRITSVWPDCCSNPGASAISVAL